MDVAETELLKTYGNHEADSPKARIVEVLEYFWRSSSFQVENEWGDSLREVGRIICARKGLVVVD